MNMINNNLYRIHEVLENRYYGIPQELFTSPLYKEKLNSDSKILYSFLLDRLTLSQKNNWYDENKNIYLIFTRQEVQEKLSLSDKTVTKAFKQLSESNLIYEKRQGLGKPNLIFVGKVQYVEKESVGLHNRKNYDCGIEKKSVVDTENLRTINTNHINTDNINTNHILSNQDERRYEEIFKSNIEYEILKADNKISKILEDIVAVSVELLNSNKNYTYINSEQIKTTVVKSQILKLRSYHITYVINCLKANVKDIRSIKSYILTSLYNSINTFNIDVTVQSARIMNSL